jgi:hypothetical protein
MIKRIFIALALMFSISVNTSFLFAMGKLFDISISSTCEIIPPKKGAVSEIKTPSQQNQEQSVVKPAKPKYVRGIHLTSWAIGSQKKRESINEILNKTEINTLVIDIKESEGDVYIPGAALVEKYGTYTKAMPDIKSYLADLKKRDVYSIARIVVFKDDLMTRKKP